MKPLIVLGLLLFALPGMAQVLQKPAPYQIAAAPTWAQLMYTDTANVFAVDRAFRAYYREHVFEKSYHTQYYKRWRRFVEPYLDIRGYAILPTASPLIPDQQMMPTQSSSRSGNWSLVGPLVAYNTDANFTAHQSNIYSIDQHMIHPNVLYCGSETGEVYRSNDEAETWTNVSLNQAFDGGILSVEIHPTDTNTVYVGAGSYIYKSTDGGLTWSVSLNMWQLQAHELLVIPSQPNVVLAATRQGVYRTTDGGQVWTQLFPEAAYDLKCHTANDSIVFLLKHDAAAGICQFLRSVDAGATFVPQTNGWYSSTDPNRFDGGGRLAVTAADPDYVYAYLIGESKMGDNGYIGVYKSIDGGLSWTLPNGPAGGPYDTVHINLAIGTVGWQYHQGFYNCAIMASPTNPEQIRVGGLNLYGSDDGGATFYPLAGYVGGPYNIHVDMQDFRVAGNTSWVTTDGGIYLSSDFFTTNAFEVRMYGIHSSDYWGFGSGWNEDVLIGGLYHNGNLSFHENYGAGNFLQLGGGEPASGYVNQGENRRVYSSDIDGRILPLQIGDPVKGAGFGIDPNERYWEVESTELEFDPRCYSTAYTGKDHQLWKTADKGSTFQLFAEFGTEPDNRITYIEPSWTDPDVMYVCQQNVTPISRGILWKTTDGGQTWRALSLPAAGNTRKMLLQVDPEDHDRVWIAFSGTPNGQKVFRSVNGGSTWINITTPTLNDQSIRSMSLIGGTDGGVYLATYQTIFYRNNSLSDWVDYGNGLPLVVNSNISRPFYRDGKLRVATYGKGIWESPLYEPQDRPVAQIMVDKLEATNHCEPNTFYYVCHSMLNHRQATWEWTFQGGMPATANTWQANVVYDVPGTYLTTLKVTEADGDVSIDSLYITIDPFQPLASLSEDFETAFPPNGFAIINPDESITWELKDDVGGFGSSSHAMFIRGYDYTEVGQLDDAEVSVDMTNLYDAWLSFDVAYARWGGGYSDTLEVLVSTDCGQTHQSLYFLGGTDLATAPDFQDGWFIPADTQWRKDSIDLSAFAGYDDVIITFRHHCGWGQNMYLDNIQLDAQLPVGQQEPVIQADYLSLYPNPVSRQSNLYVKTNVQEPVTVHVYAMDGKQVYRGKHAPGTTVATARWVAGSYIYLLSTNRLISRGVVVVQ